MYSVCIKCTGLNVVVVSRRADQDLLNSLHIWQ